MEGFEKSPRKGKKKEGEKVTEERGTDGEKGDSGEEEFDSENSFILSAKGILTGVNKFLHLPTKITCSKSNQHCSTRA